MQTTQNKQNHDGFNKLVILNQIADDWVISEMLTSRRKVCDDCQANKVLCILQPTCGPNRDFLDILLGISYKDIPKFCYNQRLREVKRRLDLEDEIPSGTKVTLADYLLFNGENHSQPITFETLETLEGFIAGINLHPLWVAAINNNMVMIDVELDEATFNPWNFRVTSKDFEPIVAFLFKCIDFSEPYRLVEEHRDFWILEVIIKISPGDLEALNALINQSQYLFAYNVEKKDLIRLVAEIPLTQSYILLRKLKKVVAEIAALLQKLPTTGSTTG